MTSCARIALGAAGSGGRSIAGAAVAYSKGRLLRRHRAAPNGEPVVAVTFALAASEKHGRPACISNHLSKLCVMSALRAASSYTCAAPMMRKHQRPKLIVWKPCHFRRREPVLHTPRSGLHLTRHGCAHRRRRRSCRNPRMPSIIMYVESRAAHRHIYARFSPLTQSTL